MASTPSVDASLGRTNGFDDVNSSQHIRDLKLAIEYKHCGKNAPGGVFIIPEMDSLRDFDGVIFVRRGLYRNGIFRFSFRLPEMYNSLNTHPEIIFHPPIFNPFVDMKTGILDLKLDPVLKEWHPEKHFITTALTFVKKIFYMKSYSEYGKLANEEARIMFDNDKDKFLEMVQKTVDDSLHRVYQEQPPNAMLIFTEQKPAHDVIREKIFADALTDENGSTGRRMDSSRIENSPDMPNVYSPHPIRDIESETESSDQ